MDDKQIKTDTKPHKMTANQIAIAALSAQGLTQTEIGKQLGLSKTHVNQTHTKFVKSGKYDLAKKANVKGAIKTIVALSQGQPIGTIETVKDSTALTAASLIYDRYDPQITRIQQDVRTQSIQITPDIINAMSDYLKLKADIENDNGIKLIDNINIDNNIKEIKEIKEIEM